MLLLLVVVVVDDDDDDVVDAHVTVSGPGRNIHFGHM